MNMADPDQPGIGQIYARFFMRHSTDSWFFEPPLWKIGKSIGMMTFPIYGKIKNVPNHQPDKEWWNVALSDMAIAPKNRFCWHASEETDSPGCKGGMLHPQVETWQSLWRSTRLDDWHQLKLAVPSCKGMLPIGPQSFIPQWWSHPARRSIALSLRVPSTSHNTAMIEKEHWWTRYV